MVRDGSGSGLRLSTSVLLVFLHTYKWFILLDAGKRICEVAFLLNQMIRPSKSLQTPQIDRDFLG